MVEAYVHLPNEPTWFENVAGPPRHCHPNRHDRDGCATAPNGHLAKCPWPRPRHFDPPRKFDDNIVANNAMTAMIHWYSIGPDFSVIPAE